jgi:hypothetical protein
MRFGEAERRTHDYVRHGTTTLFAALEVATGRITADACLPRHRNGEFLAFLKLVAKAHPRVKLHVVCDNYATHNHPTVKAWLAQNPRITLHFMPSSARALIRPYHNGIMWNPGDDLWDAFRIRPREHRPRGG